MTDKPSRSEEEFFARKEAELLKARRAEADRERADAERKSHFMVRSFEPVRNRELTQSKGRWARLNLRGYGCCIV